MLSNVLLADNKEEGLDIKILEGFTNERTIYWAKPYKQYAIVPADTYALLLEKAEMLDDIKAYDEAMAIDEELVPVEVVDRLITGEYKIKVWREYRGISQVALAEKVNMAQATIAQIEVGKRIGSVATLKKIAGALNIDLDGLA